MSFRTTPASSVNLDAPERSGLAVVIRGQRELLRFREGADLCDHIGVRRREEQTRERGSEHGFVRNGGAWMPPSIG